MSRVNRVPQPCPSCEQLMIHMQSLPAGSAYESGDVVKRQAIVHYYECVPCDGTHMLTDAGLLVSLGPPTKIRAMEGV